MVAVVAGVAGLGAAGCGDLKGFGGPVPPLGTFTVVADEDPSNPLPATTSLQVALVWGAQWLTEAFCILPAESADAAAVIAAGCRDPLGFVPARVAMTVPIAPGTPVQLSLQQLPAPDLLIGPITGRVAYGSMVVYDDRDGNGLELAQPHRLASGGRGPQADDTVDSNDVIYGASFITMTAPDQRVAYLEGTFDENGAFYPRAGCGPPSPGFSVLSAGGFTAAAALAATVAKTLPQEDPTTCSTVAPAAAVINVALDTAPAAMAAAREVGCVERTDDSSIRYREPPANEPDFTDRIKACAHLPTFDTGSPSSLIQLVVSGRSTDRCVGLTHYTLRGCRENVSCSVPDWDFTANPPAWWPCPQ